MDFSEDELWHANNGEALQLSPFDTSDKGEELQPSPFRTSEQGSMEDVPSIEQMDEWMNPQPVDKGTEQCPEQINKETSTFDFSAEHDKKTNELYVQKVDTVIDILDRLAYLLGAQGAINLRTGAGENASHSIAVGEDVRKALLEALNHVHPSHGTGENSRVWRTSVWNFAAPAYLWDNDSPLLTTEQKSNLTVKIQRIAKRVAPNDVEWAKNLTASNKADNVHKRDRLPTDVLFFSMGQFFLLFSPDEIMEFYKFLEPLSSEGGCRLSQDFEYLLSTLLLVALPRSHCLRRKGNKGDEEWKIMLGGSDPAVTFLQGAIHHVLDLGVRQYFMLRTEDAQASAYGTVFGMPIPKIPSQCNIKTTSHKILIVLSVFEKSRNFKPSETTDGNPMEAWEADFMTKYFPQTHSLRATDPEIPNPRDHEQTVANLEQEIHQATRLRALAEIVHHHTGIEVDDQLLYTLYTLSQAKSSVFSSLSQRDSRQIAEWGNDYLKLVGTSLEDSQSPRSSEATVNASLEAFDNGYVTMAVGKSGFNDAVLEMHANEVEEIVQQLADVLRQVPDSTDSNTIMNLAMSQVVKDADMSGKTWFNTMLTSLILYTKELVFLITATQHYLVRIDRREFLDVNLERVSYKQAVPKTKAEADADFRHRYKRELKSGLKFNVQGPPCKLGKTLENNPHRHTTPDLRDQIMADLLAAAKSEQIPIHSLSRVVSALEQTEMLHPEKPSGKEDIVQGVTGWALVILKLLGIESKTAEGGPVLTTPLLQRLETIEIHRPEIAGLFYRMLHQVFELATFILTDISFEHTKVEDDVLEVLLYSGHKCGPTNHAYNNDTESILVNAIRRVKHRMTDYLKCTEAELPKIFREADREIKEISKVLEKQSESSADKEKIATNTSALRLCLQEVLASFKKRQCAGTQHCVTNLGEPGSGDGKINRSKTADPRKWAFSMQTLPKILKLPGACSKGGAPRSLPSDRSAYSGTTVPQSTPPLTKHRYFYYSEEYRQVRNMFGSMLDPLTCRLRSLLCQIYPAISHYLEWFSRPRNREPKDEDSDVEDQNTDSSDSEEDAFDTTGGNGKECIECIECRHVVPTCGWQVGVDHP